MAFIIPGTAAADDLDLSVSGKPRSGDVYDYNGLAGNDNLYLGDYANAGFSAGYKSTGFTIGAADAAGMITVTGASSGGTSLTFILPAWRPLLLVATRWLQHSIMVLQRPQRQRRRPHRQQRQQQLQPQQRQRPRPRPQHRTTAIIMQSQVITVGAAIVAEL